MDNKIIFENYLLILKSTVEVYIHGTLESSNEKVRMTLKQNLNDILLNQNETFNMMTKNNWYKVENIGCNIINKTLKRLENEK